MQRIVIIGAGGHAREQLDLIAALNGPEPRYTVDGFVVDPEYGKPGERVRGLPILGGFDWLQTEAASVHVVCAIGDSAARQHAVERLRAAGIRWQTLVHPSASVGPTVTLGEGVIVSAAAVLTSDIEVGEHTHVNVGASISHDCALGSFVSVSPGCRLAGGVTVGAGSVLGVGTVVRDRVRLGAKTMTGAGAAVVDDLPGDCTAVGVPARVTETTR